MNRGGGDKGFRSQLRGKRALKVIYSHKKRLLTKNGLIAINSRTAGKPELMGRRFCRDHGVPSSQFLPIFWVNR
jgi:hypothetical protein